MEYRFFRTDSAAVFQPEGRLDSPGSRELDIAVRARVLPDDRAVIFDMGGVAYISSAGIRVFSSLDKTLRTRNGQLCLCAVQPSVGKVLEITGFNRVFTIYSTPEEALRHCGLDRAPAEDVNDGRTRTAHTRIASESFPDHEAILTVNGSCRGGDLRDSAPEELIPAIFTPDGYSAGIGIPGESVEDGLSGPGPLLTIGGAIFWKPAGSTDPPDFLIPKADAPRVIISTAFSVNTGRPFHEILLAEPIRREGFTLAELFSDIVTQTKNARGSTPAVMSAVILAGTADPAGIPDPGNRKCSGQEIPSCGEKTLVAAGICIDRNGDLSVYDREVLDTILCQGSPGPERDGLFLYQYGLLFDTPPSFTTRDLERLVAATVEREPCSDLSRLSPGTRLLRALAGVTYITDARYVDRMPVHLCGECPGWNRTFETLARWLYPGCTELELTPLSGGFSGTLVFRVRARDSRGMTMMPLVMKLGAWPLIEAEIRGYTGHVKRYIQNNATQIIETERIGNYGGILYNFVGIRGAESRIFSLEDYYLTHTTDEVLDIFDSLFRIVLNGWYKEPKKKEMALYREYGTFWKYPDIRAYAATRFGAIPEMEEIELPFGLGRSVNPLYFVEKIMTGRLSELFSVYESSVHGDLNMKNVLMDETKNLWLIDFSDTRYSHILRDIVKLEAVLTGEMGKINSRDRLRQLVELEVPFLSVRSLAEIPPLPPSIRDPDLEKAFRCVHNLRKQACLVTCGDDDITQYYLGLLPFTLNMLSYTSVNEHEKEFGWIAASLICRQLTGSGR